MPTLFVPPIRLVDVWLYTPTIHNEVPEVRMLDGEDISLCNTNKFVTRRNMTPHNYSLLSALAGDHIHGSTVH